MGISISIFEGKEKEMRTEIYIQLHKSYAPRNEEILFKKTKLILINNEITIILN